MRLRNFCLSLVAFLAAISFARAQVPPGGNANALAALATDNEMIRQVLMPDADVDTFVSALQIYTGKVILRPNQLNIPGNGTFNLMITSPMSKGDVIRAIETVLELNGIAVVQVDDKFLKIVSIIQARSEAPRIINGSALDLPPSGSIATKIFFLDFLPLAQVQLPIQQGMLTPTIGNGGLVALPSANAFMVTDTVSNLQRIELFLSEADKPTTSNLRPKLYPLHNARATTLVTVLGQAINQSLLNQLGPTTTYRADDRTNQIVLIADPRVYPFFDSLIASLDIKSDPNTRQEVILLKSADATILAPQISNLINGQTQAAQRANAGTVRPGTGVQVINPGTTPGFTPTPAAPVAAAAAPAAPAAAGGAAGAAGASGAGTSNDFSSLVSVIASARENALIVNGTADDVRLIRELVDKLDTQLAQVSIDVIIAEVTLDDTTTSGVSALGLTVGTDTPGGTVIPGTTAGTTQTVAGSVNSTRGTHIQAFSAGNIGGWGITGGIVNPLAFNAVMADAGHKSTVKIVQANTITTTHNKAGTFAVTEQRPYPAGSTTTNGTTTAQTAYIDIGIKVTVTPLVGADGTIQMSIDQTVDNLIGTVAVGTDQVPDVGHRQATATVSVKDGQMIVLGGLQSRTQSNSRQKLGFLFEIPIVSNLLGSRAQGNQRTELLFFISPHIIKQGDSTMDAKKHIDELSNKDQINQLLDDPAKPVKRSILDLVK